MRLRRGGDGNRPLRRTVVLSVILGIVASGAVALLEAADLSGPSHPIVSSPESGDQPVGDRLPKSRVLFVVESDVRSDTPGAGAQGTPGSRLWLDIDVQKPLVSSRLEFCSEFTKPASSCIRLMGTPKNHRSPPA